MRAPALPSPSGDVDVFEEQSDTAERLDGIGVDEAPTPASRKRGRPVGWRMPTLPDLSSLTLEDFAFVRGVVSGMKPVAAFKG